MHTCSYVIVPCNCSVLYSGGLSSTSHINAVLCTRCGGSFYDEISQLANKIAILNWNKNKRKQSVQPNGNWHAAYFSPVIISCWRRCRCSCRCRYCCFSRLTGQKTYMSNDPLDHTVPKCCGHGCIIYYEYFHPFSLSLYSIAHDDDASSSLTSCKCNWNKLISNEYLKRFANHIE